MTTAEHYHWNQ